jgi:hypothetical protein
MVKLIHIEVHNCAACEFSRASSLGDSFSFKCDHRNAPEYSHLGRVHKSKVMEAKGLGNVILPDFPDWCPLPNFEPKNEDS